MHDIIKRIIGSNPHFVNKNAKADEASKAGSNSYSDRNSYSDSYWFDLIFFDRQGLNTVFAEEMRFLAAEIHLIDNNNLVRSQSVIMNAKVDILLYLAIPTEKITYFLAHAR